MKVLALTLVLIVINLTLAARSRASPSMSQLWAGFMCIHRYEGPWNDAGAPYYGGLQMDIDFQRAYGPEFLRAYGTADHWPPAVQVAVAMRAYLSGRGYWPWPNTARICGLI